MSGATDKEGRCKGDVKRAWPKMHDPNYQRATPISHRIGWRKWLTRSILRMNRGHLVSAGWLV